VCVCVCIFCSPVKLNNYIAVMKLVNKNIHKLVTNKVMNDFLQYHISA